MIEDAQAAENKARANLLRFRFDFSIGGELDAYRDAVEARVRLADSARIEALEAIARVIAKQECHCDEAYTARGRHEPNAWHDDFEFVIENARAYFAAVSAAPEDWCAFPFYPIVDHEIDREHPRPCGRPESDPVHQPFFADGSPLHVFVAPEEAAHGE